MTSSYLKRPIRTEAEAMADIEAERRRAPAHWRRDGQPIIGKRNWHDPDQDLKQIAFVEGLPDSRVNRDWLRWAKALLAKLEG